MKTKIKMFAMLEIAFVLCSVFLVSLPVIAADQNQGMQKVSATASEVTTASEDDYVLGIYGNANEDDTIDMGDVVYIKLAIFGKKPKTELCDAKYDGRINVLDVIQTKLIILGKEKELTIVDSLDRIVTVKKPLKRIIATNPEAIEALRSLKVPKDIIVGVGMWPRPLDPVFFAEFSDVPCVGWTEVEAMLELNPDFVVLSTINKPRAFDVLETAGIPAIAFRLRREEGHREDKVETLGYIFDKEEEADEYLDWREEILNSIKERVEKIPEEAKPKVYYEHTRYRAVDEGRARIKSAGGVSIYPDIPSLVSVDPEDIIEKNPEIIVRTAWGLGGYDVDADDTAEFKAVREDIMSRPELQKVKAVKTRKVYLINGHLQNYGPYCGCRYIFQLIYMAKWFHPELFKDLDPKALHQEYLTRFQGLDYDLDKKGVFVYPEPG
jgi:iron complex transport system substrate-binding protein